MSNADDELLEAWLDECEALQERGEPVTLETLVGDRHDLLPRLIERLERLSAMNRFLHADASVSPRPPASGRYEPEHLHARGGLGEVFVATDHELGRTVALKRLNADQSRWSENRQRFELEAKITAKLEHPGIVPVYGLSHDSSGNPAYAMRLVDGETMAGAIRRFHDQLDAKSPSESTTVAFQQLLRQYLALCQTVAYAHSRGVLHRDIKPDNVMLGAYGEVILLDWGLATFRAESGAPHGSRASVLAELEEDLALTQTRQGMIKGSPAYMSPEQAEGRWDALDFRSDIYSLGATLYQILAGSAPFAGDTREVLEQVKRGQVPRPSAQRRDIPKPLEAICLRAMQQRPERRYPSADDLASDIERWLADEPVSAWHEPSLVRTMRWMRRHRTTVTGLAAAAAVLLVCLTTATWLLSRKNAALVAAQQEAVAAYQKAQVEQGKAETSLQTGLDAIETLLIRYGYEHLEAVPSVNVARARVLDDAVRFLQGFPGYEGNAQLQFEQGRARRFLGTIHALLGNGDPARISFQQAAAIQQRLVDENPAEQQYRLELARTWHETARLLVMNDPDEALRAIRRSVSLFEEVSRAGPEYLHDLAAAQNLLAIVTATQGLHDESTKAYERALDYGRRAVAEPTEGDPFGPRLSLGQTLHNLGLAAYQHGRLDEAEQRLSEALETWDELEAEPLLQVKLKYNRREAFGTLASLMQTKGEFEMAEAYHRQVLELSQSLVDRHPEVPEFQDGLGRAHHNLGALYQQLHRFEDACEAFDAAVRRHRQVAERHPENAYFQTGLAESLAATALARSSLGHTDLAREAYRDAQRTLEQMTERYPNVTRYVTSRCSNEINYSQFLASEGDVGQAMKLIDDAILQLDRLYQDASQDHLLRHELLNANGAAANILLGQKRYAEAVSYCDKVVEHATVDQKASWRLWRLMTLARAGDSRTWQEVTELSAMPGWSFAEYVHLAQVAAVASTTIGKPPGP